MPSASRTVEIVLKATDKASAPIRAATQELGSLERIGSALGTAFAALGLTLSAGAVYQLGQLGAESIRAKTSLGVLMGGAEEATRALQELRAATSGEVSDMQLASAATELLVSGVATTRQEMVRLMRAAEGLGDVMGMDATQAIEAFSRALLYRTPRALRSLGIDADNVQARMKRLLETQRGLTEEQAFTEAALQEVEAVLARMGEEDGAVYSTLDAFDRLRASTDNLKASLGEGLYPALADVADRLNEWLFQNAERERLEKVRRDIIASSETYEEMLERFRAFAKREGYVIRETPTLFSTVFYGPEDQPFVPTYEEFLGTLLERQRSLNGAQSMGAQIADRYRQSMTRLGDTLDEVGWDSDRAKEAMRGLNELMRGAVGRELSDYHDKMSGLTTEAHELEAGIRDLEGRRWLTDAQRQDLDEYRGRLADVRSEMEQVRQEHEKAMRSIVFGLVETRLSADGLTSAEFEFLMGLAERFGLIDAATREMAQGVDAALGKLASGAGAQAAMDMLERMLKASEMARLAGGARPLEQGERQQRLGALRAGRGERPEWTPPPEARRAWQDLRQEIGSVPVVWNAGALMMQGGTASVLGQGESVRLKLDAIRAAREEALPPLVSMQVEVADQQALLEGLYTIRGLIDAISGEHTITFKAGALPALPALGATAPVGGQTLTIPTPVGVPAGQVTTQREQSVRSGGAARVYNLTVNTSRDLYTVRQQFGVMEALGGQ